MSISRSLRWERDTRTRQRDTSQRGIGKLSRVNDDCEVLPRWGLKYEHDSEFSNSLLFLRDGLPQTLNFRNDVARLFSIRTLISLSLRSQLQFSFMQRIVCAPNSSHNIVATAPTTEIFTLHSTYQITVENIIVSPTHAGPLPIFLLFVSSPFYLSR